MFTNLTSTSKNSKSVWNWSNIIVDLKTDSKPFENVFNSNNITFLKNVHIDAKKGKDTQFRQCRNDLRKLSNNLINNIQNKDMNITDKKLLLKESILFFNKYSFNSFDTYFYETVKKNISEFIKTEKSK